MKYLMMVSLVLSSFVKAETMVFLVEGPHGKQVGISSETGSYSLLTSGDEWSLYPDISSDGEMITYVQGKDQTSLALYIKNLKSGEEKILTQEGFILHPRFAKNSSLIFFSEKTQSSQKIGYLNSSRFELDVLPSVSYIDEDLPSFFPTPFQSGEMLVYQRNNEEKEIVLFDLKENKKTIVGKGMSPSLSKDERFIAYTSNVNENWDIYIYDRFTEKTLKVTSDKARDFSPSFDAHNNLIYTSDRLEKGVFSIFKQKVSSWELQREEETIFLSDKGVSFYAPKVSGEEKYKMSIFPKMTGEPRSSFGAITHKESTYIIGGHQGAEHTYPPESFTGRVTRYNHKIQKWEDLLPRIYPSHGFQLAAYENYIYAFGGFAYEETTNPKWKSLDVVERYNSKKNSWEEIAPMPRRRSSNVAVQIKNKVYLIGGWDATPKSDGDIDGTFHSEIDVFDLKTSNWETLAVKLPKKRRAFSAFVKNDKIYLVGGISEGGSHFSLLDDFTEFDPQTETFKELPKLPFATFAPAAGTLGEEAYIFGGMFKTGTYNYEYVPHIYKFDFKNQKWTHTGRYLTEYKGFSQVVNVDECLGILGGHSYQNNQDKPVDSFEVWCQVHSTPR